MARNSQRADCVRDQPSFYQTLRGTRTVACRADRASVPPPAPEQQRCWLLNHYTMSARDRTASLASASPDKSDQPLRAGRPGPRLCDIRPFFADLALLARAKERPDV